MLPERIFLIGFMGSGKSLLGRQLAALLQRSFIDLDERVESAAGMSIPEIFRRHGEAYFRGLERACLLRLESEQQVIVALGGGTPCYFDNMQWILANGFSIYLRYRPELLAARLRRQLHTRPLLEGLDEAGLLRYIQDMLVIREPVYLRANCIAEDVADVQDLMDRF